MKTEDFGAALIEAGFSDFVGVPCSYLSPLINWAINENRFLIANNEGEAVSIATGMNLARFSNFNGENLENLSRFDGEFDGENLENLSCFDSENSKNLSAKKSLNSQKSKENSPNLNAEISQNKLNLAQNEPKFSVVLMQNSGLSNALSPLTSLNHTFKIPILGFVSLRGERENGVNKDEPQHELLGLITDKMLEICDIKFAFLSENLSEAKKQLNAAKSTLLKRKSFFFIVRKKCFESVNLRRNFLDFNERKNGLCILEEKSGLCEGVSVDKTMKSIERNARSSCTIFTQKTKPTRLEVLNCIKNSALNAALLATTGKCGRELYELGDTQNQLYMVGSMGCVSALALGVALKTHKKIIAIDGDSALLMRLGTLSNNAFYAKCDDKGNFCHILLDNASHDSTGGQDNLAPFVNFCELAKNCGYESVYEARNLEHLREILGEFLNRKNGGAFFIYIKIKKGSKANLGRPKITPSAVAARFNAWLWSENV